MLDSKLRILTSAKALFLSRGYAGTTVDAICEDADLTKGSFYHFFKSKEDLALAVLHWSLETVGAALADGPHLSVTDPVERAFAYLNHFARCAPDLWRGGCLLGVYSTELASSSPRMQETVSRTFTAISAEMATILQPVVEACSPGNLPSALDLADQFFGALEGAIILAKAHQQPERIERAIRFFINDLRARMAVPA